MKNATKIKGITFGLLLAGKVPARSKSVTRRVFKTKNQNLESAVTKVEYEGVQNYTDKVDTGKRVAVFTDDEGNDFMQSMPYRIGQILYIREPWQTAEKFNKLKPRELPDNAEIAYLSDNGGAKHEFGGRKRLARFLMKRYARSFIKITGLRYERLHQIDHDDCVAEGLELVVNPNGRKGYDDEFIWLVDGKHISGSINAFAALWDSVNKEKGKPKWAENPWVLRIAFDYIDMPNPFNLSLPWDCKWDKCDGEWLYANHDHILGCDYAMSVTLLCDGDSDKWPWKWRISIGGKVKDDGKMDTAEDAKSMAVDMLRMKLEHLHEYGWEDGFGVTPPQTK